MKSITCLGISTAVCCAVWSFLSPELGLLSWAGFAGCTSYFACPDHGWKGVKSAFFCTHNASIFRIKDNDVRIIANSNMTFFSQTIHSCRRSRNDIYKFLS